MKPSILLFKRETIYFLAATAKKIAKLARKERTRKTEKKKKRPGACGIERVSHVPQIHSQQNFWATLAIFPLALSLSLSLSMYIIYMCMAVAQKGGTRFRALWETKRTKPALAPAL